MIDIKYIEEEVLNAYHREIIKRFRLLSAALELEDDFNGKTVSLRSSSGKILSPVVALGLEYVPLRFIQSP
jgi:hypothetical protein